MKKIIILLAAATVAVTASATVPHKAQIPDIPGYVTLKGDCHVHTIFSDATVWPTTRVAEADYEGLDFIMMTDHCDTRHMKMVAKGYFNGEKVDRNTSYELALAEGKKRDLMVIHGAELTLGKWIFPGHFNLFFIQDGNKIAQAAEAAMDEAAKAGKDEKTQQETGIVAGLQEARRQGAFIQWNHPDWETQAHNDTKWLPIHDLVFNSGLMDGIEIVNRFSGYDQPAHTWSVEKKLTITGGTDCHKPMFEDVDWACGEFRPMTLVFARDRSEAAIREAMEARRTAVWADNHIYGPEEVLVPLFKEIFEISDVKYSEKSVSFTVTNNSSVPLTLTKAPGSEKVVYPRLKYINAGETVTISVKGINNTVPMGVNAVDVNFYVNNFETEPGKPIQVGFHFDIPMKYVKHSDEQVEISPAFKELEYKPAAPQRPTNSRPTRK
ncbi:MAG: Sb-PDE family phosphodiesterase [Bacteroidales bacterium]|nr:Sb-PDE family phosphodiesterase [Bacteroidales bacterium]